MLKLCKKKSQRWRSPACAYLWNHKKKEVSNMLTYNWS